MRWRTQYHFHSDEPGAELRDAWEVVRLIEVSRGLPIETRHVESFGELDSVYWFDRYTPATVRRVIEHAQLVDEVDLRHPVVTASDGRVMDGMHRVARALRDGIDHVDVVQFETDPEPTYRNCRPENLPYLRPAVDADAPAIVEIERQGTAQLQAIEGVEMDVPVETVADIEQAIASGRVTVAYRRPRPDESDDTEVVGWSWLDLAEEEPYLAQVSVLPAHQGDKVGSLLIRTMLLELRIEAHSSLILNTQANVPWNQPLYEHLGWTVVPPDAWTDQMRRHTEHQIEAGIGWKNRVHMRRQI